MLACLCAHEANCVCMRVHVYACVCVSLTGSAVDAVASRLAVLAGGAMETLVAAALPIATETVLTLPVIGTPAANVSGAFEAL